MEPVRPAEVLTGRLDAARLDELWSDLERDAEDVRIAVRDAPGRMSHDAPITLAAARDALAHGRSVALRYVVDGRAWSDTLLPDGDGARLVRCAS